MVLFFSVGLNSTSLSRVILNLRNINRNRGIIGHSSISIEKSNDDWDRGRHDFIASLTRHTAHSSRETDTVRVHKEVEVTLDSPTKLQCVVPMDVRQPSTSPKSRSLALYQPTSHLPVKWKPDKSHLAPAHSSPLSPSSSVSSTLKTPFSQVDKSAGRDGVEAFIFNPTPPRNDPTWLPESITTPRYERRSSTKEDYGSIELRRFTADR